MFTLRLAGGTEVTSPPCSKIRPASGVSNPAIIRSVVVLPHPLGPSIEKNSPPGIVIDTASTAVTSSKRLRDRVDDDLALVAGRGRACVGGSVRRHVWILFSRAKR